MSRMIPANKVFQVALEAKVINNWCDTGFNEAMSKLGFKPVETVTVPVDPNAPEPTPKGDGACFWEGCKLCYDNPRRTKNVVQYIHNGKIVWGE